MEHDSFRNVKWFVLAYFVLLILLLTLIGVFGQLGYAFIDMGLACALFGLLICSALIAGTVWLVRRFCSRAAKILAGCTGALLTIATGVALAMVCSMLLNFGVPAHYTTLVSEDGDAAVVLRMISGDAQLRELRVAEYGTTQDENTLDFSVLGYSYSAYPRVMHFFYDTERPAEGKLEIGCASAALLKYEWTEPDKLHLFIGDAEIGDAGELTLKLD